MLSTPSSVFCNGLLLILLAMNPDKSDPAGIEMSLEWKHVPQYCMGNDQYHVVVMVLMYSVQKQEGGGGTFTSEIKLLSGAGVQWALSLR